MLDTHPFWMKFQEILVPQDYCTITHSQNLLTLRWIWRFENFFFLLAGVLSWRLKEFPISHFLSKQIAVHSQKRHRSANVLRRFCPFRASQSIEWETSSRILEVVPLWLILALYGREENVCEDNDWKISLDKRRGRDSFFLKTNGAGRAVIVEDSPFLNSYPR